MNGRGEDPNEPKTCGYSMLRVGPAISVDVKVEFHMNDGRRKGQIDRSLIYRQLERRSLARRRWLLHNEANRERDFPRKMQQVPSLSLEACQRLSASST